MVMNQNPYAAPAQAYAPPPPPPPTGQPGQLDASDAFSLAWALFKKNGGPLVGAGFFVGILGGVTGQVPNGLKAAHVVDATTAGILSLVTLVFSLALNAFLQPGFVRMALQTARGEQPSFGVLFSGADRFWPMLGLYLLTFLAVVVGCAALIIPGIFLSLAMSFASFYVVDAKLGPIEAIKASFGIVRVQWGQVFLFWLLFTLVGVGGMLMCCVGYFPAIALGQLAAGVAFVKMSGRGVVPPATAPGGWPAPPAA
jgi:hypothetical protein